MNPFAGLFRRSAADPRSDGNFLRHFSVIATIRPSRSWYVDMANSSGESAVGLLRTPAIRRTPSRPRSLSLSGEPDGCLPARVSARGCTRLPLGPQPMLDAKTCVSTPDWQNYRRLSPISGHSPNRRLISILCCSDCPSDLGVP